MSKPRYAMVFACTLALSACGGSSTDKKPDETTTEQQTTTDDSMEEPTGDASAEASATATTETTAPPAETGPDFADPNVEGDEFFQTWFKVTGQVDPEQVRGTIGRNKDSIYECYKKELPDNPGLAGRVLMSITSNGAGQVASAIVKKSTLDNKSMETCMTSSIRDWKMPQSKDGGLVMVQYPFVLPP